MADLPFPSVIGLKDGCHAPCKAIPLSHTTVTALMGCENPKVRTNTLQKGKETKSMFNNKIFTL